MLQNALEVGNCSTYLQRAQLFFGGGNMNSGETTKFRKVVLSDKELWRFSSEKLINEKNFPYFMAEKRQSGN